MAKKKTQRYRIMNDDSGHQYVIPAELRDEFEVLLEDPDTFEDKFGECRLGKHLACLTFIDPKQD